MLLRLAFLTSVIFFGVLGCSQAWSDTLKKIEVSDSDAKDHTINLAKEAYLQVGAAQKSNIEEIRNHPPEAWNRADTYRAIPAGNTWLQILVDVKTINYTNWYVNLPSWVNYIEFYYEVDGEIVASQIQGSRFPFSHRILEHRKNLLPLTFRENSFARLFLYIENPDAIFDPVELVEVSRFHINDTKITSFLYFLFGCLAVMTVYNFFVFLSVRDLSYLYYSLQMAFMALSLFSIYGFAYQWLWPNSPSFQFLSRGITLEISMFFSTLFCLTFLQVKTFSKTLVWVLLFIAFSHLLINLGNFIPFIEMQVAYVYIMFTYCFYIGVGIYAWKRKISAAPYYTFAWVGVVLAIWVSFGVLVIQKYLETVRSVPYLLIAVVLEAVLLSFALAARIKSLQKLEIKEKNQFLALVSHEMRTPLNGIMGSLSLLDTPDKSQEDRESINFLNRSASQLNNIVVGILSFTEGRKPKTLEDPEAHNLSDLLKDLRKELVDISNRKCLFLSIAISPDIPDQMCFDYNRLHTILFNLLENGFKFTEEGYVTLHVTLLRKEEDLFYIRFSVRDTGVGIARDQLRCIFRAFKQTEQFYSREHEGLGLGLSIAAQNVALMGSKINVTSTPNKGSHFYFEICLRKAELASSTLETKSYSILTALRILYVEDNTVNQLVTKKILEKNGYQVDIAVDGREGLNRVLNNNYDIVLMDCSMPIMSGFEATKAIRDAGYVDLPIIAVTANAMSGDKENCLKSGMNDYIAKPVNKSELVTKIEKAWRNKLSKAC